MALGTAGLGGGRVVVVVVVVLGVVFGLVVAAVEVVGLCVTSR